METGGVEQAGVFGLGGGGRGGGEGVGQVYREFMAYLLFSRRNTTYPPSPANRGGCGEGKRFVRPGGTSASFCFVGDVEERYRYGQEVKRRRPGSVPELSRVVFFPVLGVGIVRR